VLWSNLRAEQLAVISYVERRDPAALSESAQRQAITSLENSITETLNSALSSTTSSGTQAFTCSGAASGAQTLASMPAWFIAEQVEAEAATLALAKFAGPPIPTSGPGLEAWYKLNSAKFDTYCVGIVVVPEESSATEIAQRINSGSLTIAEAAKQYSTDPTSLKGGAVGCFGPTNSSYAAVQADLAGLKTGQVGVHFDQQTDSWVLIGATSATSNEFAAVATQVAQSAVAANADAAGIKATEIQKAAGITVDPAIGSWVVTSAGGTIAQPPVPPSSSVLNSSANLPVSSSAAASSSTTG
jgi:parvulin-like peptidyl-prolyl isomerase